MARYNNARLCSLASQMARRERVALDEPLPWGAAHSFSPGEWLILSAYPGALLLVSHDAALVEAAAGITYVLPDLRAIAASFKAAS